MFSRIPRFLFRCLLLLALSGMFARTPAVYADSGARTVKYAEADIIPIHAKIRFSTLILLPVNEEILDATTGDKEFWIINGAHNLCYLHPAQQGIRSNLNLITSMGHVYSFLLTEISNEPNAEPDLKIFIERKEESTINGASAVPPLARASEVQAYKTAVDVARAEAAQTVQAAEERAQREISQYRQQYAGKLAFDYSYNSKAARAPFSVSAIYHDDKFTYIKCSAQEKPTIYEVKDGKPNLINFELANGVYVIPKIVDQGYLAVGKKKLPGPVNCMVTTDVYSHDHQHILIPAGTKVLGEAKKVEAFGQQRLAVFFHRLIMPDGYSVSLDQFKGFNQIGETALRDKVNNHYLQIFGASLAVGILGGVAEAGTGNVLTNSPLDRVREGFGASIANSSMNILDRFLNVLPTVTIREGNRVKVYLSGDLLLPDYAQHTMQPDL